MACSQEPAEIHYGSDECAYCKMMITDPQFASQIVTAKGKAITFDSIECLATYQKEHSRELKEAKLWVPDFSDPGHWLNAVQARYVKSEDIQSPMGESLLALPSAEAAQKHTTDKPGQLIKWKEVKQLKMEMNMNL
jgi:copper chaperone NosL